DTWGGTPLPGANKSPTYANKGVGTPITQTSGGASSASANDPNHPSSDQYWNNLYDFLSNMNDSSLSSDISGGVGITQ
ncbi:MAG: hypothetical protein ACHQ6U_09595, partial [Thermodesulfobacteriota bacterium]